MPTVIGDEYSVNAIRRALIVYFKIEPKIRKLKRPEDIKEVLDDREYRGYVGALYLLRNSRVSGDALIEMLSNGDHSPFKYKSLVKILSRSSLIIRKEDIWFIFKNKESFKTTIIIFISLIGNVL